MDSSDGTQKWRFQTDDKIRSSPMVVDGTVYVGSDDGTLYAVNASDGTKEWNFVTRGKVDSSPTVLNGTVCVGSHDQVLYALETSNGRLKWNFGTGDKITSSPVVVSNTIHIESLDGNLYAIDLFDGTKEWEFDLGHISFSDFYSSPTIYNNTIYAVSGYPTYGLHAVHTDGTMKWVFKTSDNRHSFSTPTATEESIYVTSRDGNLYSINRADGTMVWKFETGGIRSSPTVADGTVYFGSRDKNLYAVDASSGKQKWSFKTERGWWGFSGGPVHSSPTVVDGVVYFGSNDGNLYSLETDNSKSSGGSRVNLGTLGHHNEWTGEQHPDTASEVADSSDDKEAKYQGDSPRHKREHLPSSESQSVEIDELLKEAQSLAEKAEADLKSGDLDVALEHAKKAVDKGETALNQTSESDNRRLEKSENVLNNSQRLFDRIQNQKETYENMDAELGEMETNLGSSEKLLDKGEPKAAIEQIDDVPEGLEELHSKADENAFNGLQERINILKRRYESIVAEARSKRIDDKISNNIPDAPIESLTYDGIEKVEPVGSGGNADVYRAVADTPRGEITFALKEPRMSGTLHKETAERMMQEAETWDRLDDHDHIVGLIDYDSEPLPWIAMEYMDGGHLGELAGQLESEQAIWTAIATTKAVRHAHRRGVAHLDLKPENVLFRKTDDKHYDVPKVADWGLSKHLLDHSKSVEGLSPQYSAPEQFDSNYGKADDITDVYQLGAVFYEMFTGEPPFEGDPARVMNKVMNEEPTPPSQIADVPSEIDEILLTAMATEKEDRYESVLYLRDSLRELYSTS